MFGWSLTKIISVFSLNLQKEKKLHGKNYSKNIVEICEIKIKAGKGNLLEW